MKKAVEHEVPADQHLKNGIKEGFDTARFCVIRYWMGGKRYQQNMEFLRPIAFRRSKKGSP